MRKEGGSISRRRGGEEGGGRGRRGARKEGGGLSLNTDTDPSFLKKARVARQNYRKIRPGNLPKTTDTDLIWTSNYVGLL